jgi:sortase A
VTTNSNFQQGWLIRFADSLADALTITLDYFSARGRKLRKARSEELARSMPPKGWKPGMPVMLNEAADGADPGELVGAGAVVGKGAWGIPDKAGSSSLPPRRSSLRPRKAPTVPPGLPPRIEGSRRGAKKPPPPLSAQDLIIRNALAILALLILGIMINVTVISGIQHVVAQQKLGNDFKEELALATAPVSEGDFNQVLLPDGVPVAIIDIPHIGVHEVIVEGTTSGDLTSGPGHRRDTVLPGQTGTSVVMARSGAYGGPFGRLQELVPGDQFTVITGQGESKFEVIGLRYAGDPAPAPLQAGKSRLILETARGAAFVPTGVARVDAQLVSTTFPAGKRQTTYANLAPEHREMATDMSTVWALVFALQFLIAIEVALIWAYPRVGWRRAWIVFVPLFTVATLLIADQVVRLLPNLI